MIKNRVIGNASWIIGCKIIQSAVNLIITMFTARYLGPSNYGALNYTASFVSFCVSVATLGMEGVVLKKMIAKPNDEGTYLGSGIAFRLLSSFICTILVSVVVFILNPNDTLKLTLVLLQSLQLIFQAFYLIDTWFQRYLKSKYTSIGKIIACIVVSLYKIFLLVTGKSIVWFALSNSITYFVTAIMLVILYFKQGGPKFKFSVTHGKQVLDESYHFILSGLMTAIYGQMGKIMIGKMLTDTDVGLYSTATAICSMWIFVPVAIINSFRPTVMTIKQSGNEELYDKRLKQLYSFIIWLCIFVAGFVFILAPFIVRVLYGEAYLGSVTPLRIAIWLEVFSMIGTARGIWILCENKNKYVKYYLAIGAIVNLVLNFVLIPTYGIDGAAFATLITQIVTSIIAPLLFKETRHHTVIVLEAFLLTWAYKKKGHTK